VKYLIEVERGKYLKLIDGPKVEYTRTKKLAYRFQSINEAKRIGIIKLDISFKVIKDE
jgi:hypothetical protein